MKKLVIDIWNKLRSRSLVWDALTTTAWSSFGKGIGFLVPFFIAAWFGVSSQTDAFFFAYGLILFLSGIFAPVIESLIVPYIAEMISKKEDVSRFVGEILGISGLWLSLGALVFVLLVRPVLSLVTRFDADNLRLIHLLLIETVPLFVLLVWTSILTGALNAYKKFAIPATAPAIRAAVNLAFIFAFKDKMGVHAIAWGYVAGEVVRMVILSAAVVKMRLFKISVKYTIDAKIIEFVKNMSFQTAAMLAAGMNPVVDKTMASWLGKGSVSILEYAGRLYIIPITFISSGILVTALSHWSSRYHEHGLQRLQKDVKKAIKAVSLLSLLIILLLFVFKYQIVKLAFGRGEFPKDKLLEINLVFLCYLLGFFPYVLTQILVRAHIVLKNTKVLMHCASYRVFLNIILNLILMKYFKIFGIALSTSFLSVFTFVYFYAKLGKYSRQIS